MHVGVGNTHTCHTCNLVVLGVGGLMRVGLENKMKPDQIKTICYFDRKA